jgi:hypothetical protein
MACNFSIAKRDVPGDGARVTRGCCPDDTGPPPTGGQENNPGGTITPGNGGLPGDDETPTPQPNPQPDPPFRTTRNAAILPPVRMPRIPTYRNVWQAWRRAGGGVMPPVGGNQSGGGTISVPPINDPRFPPTTDFD